MAEPSGAHHPRPAGPGGGGLRRNLSALSAALVLCGALANAGQLLAVQRPGRLAALFADSAAHPPGCDFFSLYVAAGQLLRGRSVYQVPAGVDGEVPCRYPYRYLPAGLALGVPLRALSPRAAHRAWIALLELLLLVNVLLIFSVAPSPRVAGLGALLLLGSGPTFLELYMGQFSLLQGTLIFLGLAALRRGRRAAFDLWWAASLCWKLNTWIAAPALLLAGAVRPLLLGALVLALTGLPYLLLVGGPPGDLLLGLSPSMEGALLPGNHGLQALLLTLLPGADARVLPVVVLVAVLGLSLAATLRWRRAPLEDRLGLWLAAFFLVFPQVWAHHYVMLAPVLALLAAQPRPGWLLAPALLLALPTPFALAERHGWSPTWEALHHLQRPLGALLTYALCLAALRRGASPGRGGALPATPGRAEMGSVRRPPP